MLYNMAKHTVLTSHHPTEKFLPCNTYLRDMRHHLYPGLNLMHENILPELNYETAIDFYMPPTLYISHPIPCLSSKYIKQGRKNRDPINELVKKKLHWRKQKKIYYDIAKKLVSLRKTFRSTIQDVLDGDHYVRTLPYGITKLADHLANNPDKHFKGTYNWYYANILTSTSIKGEPYIFHVSGENLNKLCLSSIEASKKSYRIPTISPVANVSLTDDGFIYDIRVCESSGCVGVRQRDYCSVLNYETNTEGNLSLNDCFFIRKQDCPFISMDLYNHQICTIDANRKIQSWHSEYRGTSISSFILPNPDKKLIDKFLQLKFLPNGNSKSLFVIDRNSIYLFDTRNNNNKPSSAWYPNDQIEMCENLSLLIPSTATDYWYVGSTHSCLLLDSRRGVAGKWTHMLKEPPCIGHTFKTSQKSYDSVESLLWCTQNTDEIVAIYNNWTEGKLQHTSFPKKVSNRYATLHAAHSVGLLTNPIYRKKFDYSLIGLTTCEIKKRIRIFSSCSTGDIFYQSADSNDVCVPIDSSRLKDEHIHHLEEWEADLKTYSAFNNFPLTATEFVDMSELVESINENIEVPPTNKNRMKFKEKWKMSRKELLSYKDYSAPYLIKSYGIDDIEDWSSDVGDDYDNTAVNPFSLEDVNDWLLGKEEKVDEVQSQELFPECELEPESEETHEDEFTEIEIVVPPEFDVEYCCSSRHSRRSRKIM